MLILGHLSLFRIPHWGNVNIIVEKINGLFGIAARRRIATNHIQREYNKNENTLFV